MTDEKRESRGERFRRRLEDDYLLTGPDEMEIVTDIVATLNAIEWLEADQSIPAFREARLQRQLLLRQLGSLGLPDADGEPLPTPKQIQASKAGRARWDKQKNRRR